MVDFVTAFVTFYTGAFSSLDKPPANDQRRQASMGSTSIRSTPSADDGGFAYPVSASNPARFARIP